MAVMLTPPGVLSYPKLFVPVLPRKPKPGDVPAYETSILFTAEQIATPEYKALVAEAERIGREKFGDKFDALIKDGKLKWPFKKDIESSGYPAHIVRYVSARAKKSPVHPAPQIVARDGKTLITNPMLVYPGVRARISVSVYAYDGESKGVTFGLRNVQILGDGERLDSSVTPGAEFGGLEPEAPGDMAADMAGLLD